ncbi:mechanosensitive ion channel [Methylophilaceae bacterium]|nr:mechanosensitive ion channel [Methylophilaceae bacterium]|tara:strand:+ start:6375 stop:7649 length:1275 start_codon:yes stop_codon:yes gene_type:complete
MNKFEFIKNNFSLDFLMSIPILWQLCAILLAIGLSFFTNQIIKNYVIGSAGKNWKIATDGIVRIISPIIILIVLFFSKIYLETFQTASILGIAITLINALIIIRLGVYFIRYLVKPRPWIRALENTIASLVWVIVALYLFGLLSPIRESLVQVQFSFGDNDFSLFLVLQVLFGSALAVLFAVTLGQFIENRLMKVDQLDMNARVMLNKVFKITLYVVAVVVALSSIGLDLTFLSVFGGAFGVGLAFGMQKIASNYVCGFIILLDKSIHIGDILMVGEHYGVVTLIRSRYTVLRKLDGIEVIIPNETLISENIINHTLTDRKSRISIDVQISYKSSVDKAFEILLNSAKNESRVLNDPAPSVFLMKFADSGIDIMLSFYIVDPEEGSWGLKSDIYREIWDEFQKHGIEIPYPYRTVEIINSDKDK